jgi:arylsulfatase A-like enzyme
VGIKERTTSLRRAPVWWGAPAAALAIALVMALAEVLVHLVRATGAIGAAALSCAAIVNVTVLGVMALGGLLCGVLSGWLLRRFAPQRQNAIHMYTALLAAVILLLYLAAGRPAFGALVWCCIAGGGLAWFFEVRNISLVPAPIRTAAPILWLLGLGISVALTIGTHQQVQQWRHPDTLRAAPAHINGPNIILIVLDTLRADCVGVYGGPGLTPNLDDFTSSAIAYKAALSTAPWTLPAHASLFTGLYPAALGVSWGNLQLGADWPTLAELLRQRGYDTCAISNNWLLNQENGYARGFDGYIETSQAPYLKRWRLALRCSGPRCLAASVRLSSDAACDAGSAWTNWLVRKKLNARAAARPLFLFINYFEPHDPYRPPPRFARRMLSAEQQQRYRFLPQGIAYLAAQACGVPNIYNREQVALLKKLYEAEVAYQDQVLGELFQILREQRVFDDSWIVVTSDHGELFGESKLVHHSVGTHYKLLHVPLLVRPPGGTRGRILDAAVQPVDIFVTLVEAGGAAVPDQVTAAYPLPLDPQDVLHRRVCVAQSFGASFGSLSKSQRLQPQVNLNRWLTWLTAVYEDGYYLELDADGPKNLFNLNEDPEMVHDLLQVRPEVAHGMIERMPRKGLKVHWRKAL